MQMFKDIQTLMNYRLVSVDIDNGNFMQYYFNFIYTITCTFLFIFIFFTDEIMAVLKLDNTTMGQTNWKPCSQQAWDQRYC